MQILKQNTRIDFMRHRRTATIASLLLMAFAVGSLALNRLNFGIDFTGGTLIEVGYPQRADLAAVRAQLDAGGLEGAVAQYFGTTRDILIRIPPHARRGTAAATPAAALGDRVFELLRAADAAVEIRRVEFVGPQVGEELTEQGGLAVLVALIAILVYIALRFEYRLALGAVAALIHDVLLTLGLFSVLRIEFDLAVLAAVLAVIGYSLNDTIVVFDRVRENFRKMRTGTPLEVANASLNQTLSRTLMTSLTTLLVLLALFFVGGETIHGFALALIVGLVVGTYSSIYIAANAALALGLSKEDLIPPKKEGATPEGSMEERARRLRSR